MEKCFTYENQNYSLQYFAVDSKYGHFYIYMASTNIGMSDSIFVVKWDNPGDSCLTTTQVQVLTYITELYTLPLTGGMAIRYPHLSPGPFHPCDQVPSGGFFF